MAKEELQPDNQFSSRPIDTKTSKAPDGTYEYLVDVLDSGKNTHFRRHFYNAKEETHVKVSKERICEVTGGSCMDLFIQQGITSGELQSHHLHVSQDNRIMEFTSEIQNQNGTKKLPASSFAVEEMMKILKDIQVNPETLVTIITTTLQL